jgi:hypothetical protein
MKTIALCLALVALVGCVRNTKSKYADNTRTYAVDRSTGPFNDEVQVTDDRLPLLQACFKRLGDGPDTEALCRDEIRRRQRVYVITRDGTVVPAPY